VSEAKRHRRLLRDAFSQHESIQGSTNPR
jgi:hypothetical protein